MNDPVSSDEEIRVFSIAINDAVAEVFATDAEQLAQLDDYAKLLWVTYRMCEWTREHPAAVQTIWESMPYTDDYSDNIDGETWTAQYAPMIEAGLFRLLADGPAFHVRLMVTMHFACQRHFLAVGHPHEYWVPLIWMGQRVQGVPDEEIARGIDAVRETLARRPPDRVVGSVN